MAWRKVSFVLSSCVAVAIAAGSFAEAQTPKTPVRGGTVVVAVGQDPAAANPAITSNVADKLVGCMIYEGLVEVGSTDMRIIPQLAKSWTISPDGLTYTFNLVTAKWQDGVPFTSEDVKFSLLEVNSKYSAIFAPAGALIQNIDTPAPDKVVITLKHPYGPFLTALPCGVAGAIMPAHLFRGKDPATVQGAVGTGAFKIAEWKRGDYIRLVRNPDYYVPDRPYLDQIIVKVISQTSAQLQAVQAGEVDVMVNVPGANQVAVRNNPKIKVLDNDISPTAHYLVFNVKRKPLDDKRVRQALFMATDRDYIHKNVFFGIGREGTKPFVTDVAWANDPSIDYRKMYPFDVARANALLDEAGMKRGPDGKRFALHMLVYSTSWGEHQQVALALQSMWKAVGVDLVIDAYEDATLNKKVYQDHDFDVSMSPLSSYDDPSLGIARAFITSSIGKAFGNASGYSNPIVDDLFQKGEQATAYADRAKYYWQAEGILADDLPVAIIDEFRNADVASVKLQGKWGGGEGTGEWPQTWMEK